MPADEERRVGRRAPLERSALLATPPATEIAEWIERDVVCYALATGFGADELERAELPFLFEGRGLLVVPSFATTLAAPDWLDDFAWQRDYVLVAARHLEVFSPLLPSDSIELTSTVADAWPDASGEGSCIQVRSEARRVRDKRALFALTTIYHARSDRLADTDRRPAQVGGFTRPERDPDFETIRSPGYAQTVLFRWVTGGPARHIDTDAARRAGFERPPVPADCLAGIVCRSILATVCDYDPTLLRGLSVNFADRVFADDDLRIRMWQDGPVIAFDAASLGRRETVLDGRCILAT